MDNYTLPTKKERDAYMAGQEWGMKKVLKKIKLPIATEGDGWEMLEDRISCCPGDDAAEGWNEARKELDRIKKELLK